MEYLYTYEQFIEITNIGDRVVVGDNGTVLEGKAEMVSMKGLNIRFVDGSVKFYKWQNVKTVYKKKGLL